MHRSLESVLTRIKSIRDTVTRIIRVRTRGGTGTAGGGKMCIPVWYPRATFMEESVMAREAQETMVSIILSAWFKNHASPEITEIHFYVVFNDFTNFPRKSGDFFRKILRFLQEDITIFNRRIVSFPVKTVKFSFKK